MTKIIIDRHRAEENPVAAKKTDSETDSQEN